MDLKAKRIAAGLTRDQLAKKLGMNPQAVYNYETGRSPVPPKYIKKMAKVLGVPFGNLLAHCMGKWVDRYMKAAHAAKG